LLTLRDWRLTLGTDDVLRAQGGDPTAIRSRRPSLVEVAERAIADGLPLLRPTVHYRRLPVESHSHQHLGLSGGNYLSGPLIWQHMAPAEEVVVIACTIGPAIEERVARVMTSDPLNGLALDGFGSAAVEALTAAVCHYFEERAANKGMRATIPINPGLEGWSLKEGQKQLFDLLDSEVRGIRLLPSGMMTPRKSLSFVIGIGPNVSNNSAPCDYCEMRDRCRFRPD